MTGSKYVRIGRRTLNLGYMIEAVEDEPVPGVVRLCMAEGRTLDLTGADAAEMARILSRLTPPSGPAHAHGRRERRRLPKPE